MAIVSSDDTTLEMLEALGLSHLEVIGFSIRAHVNEAMTVDIKYYMNKEQARAVLDVIKENKLTVNTETIQASECHVATYK